MSISTAEFHEHVLTVLQRIAGNDAGVRVHSNLATAEYRQYVLQLLDYIATHGGGGGGGGSATEWIESNGSASYQLLGLLNDATLYRVTICGVEQRPNVNFTTSTDNGGTITFPVAVPENNQIGVQKIV